MQHKIILLQNKIYTLEKARDHYNDDLNYKERVYNKHNEECIKDLLEIIIELDDRLMRLEAFKALVEMTVMKEYREI